ncbi:hypothetical protein CIB84_013549 [Bambusicola thoracicus]|uniref:Uncharacterized protein n=1 Tax=Bambusicola thoracicus TaxID=9083 RepID=A0A2P4SF18_BAMTH|nr:hypothetical protein CIB84_013549 [Bambusicola thoracicus]
MVHSRHPPVRSASPGFS